MKIKKKHRSICRVCLNSSSKKCISLFENFKDSLIADHIKSITDVQIKENDGLPRKICPSCLLELGSAIDFKQKCQRSNYILETSVVGKPTEIAIETNKVEITIKKEEHSELIETFNESEFLDCLEFYNSNEIESQLAKQEVIAEEIKTVDLKVVCHDCGNLFKSKCKLRVHWKKEHLPKALVCQNCKRAFRTYKAFNRHKKDKSLACAVAGSDQVLIEGEGKSRVFYCKECSYKSLRIKDIQSHLVIHTGDRPYQCDMCPSAYTQLCALQGHKEMVHNEYKVQITCHFCGKYVKGRRRVYRHLKMHTENKVQCEVCKKMFKNKKSLDSHMKRHSGVKNYTCERCAVAFYTTAELCNHRRMVHNKGKRWFNCNQCEYKSIRSEAVRKHQAKHSEGNIPCTVCGRFVENNQKLILHQRRHFEDKNYSCPHCDVKFLRKDSVRTHIKNKHRHKIVCGPGPTVGVKEENPAVQQVTVKNESSVVLRPCPNEPQVIQIEFSPNIT